MKSEYVLLPAPATPWNSTTKWHDRQLMDSPAKGPGNVPLVVCTCATTGSLATNGSFTPVMCAAKYSAKRVSTKSRSPICCSEALIVSFSFGNCGACPEEQALRNAIAAVTQQTNAFGRIIPISPVRNSKQSPDQTPVPSSSRKQ